VGNDTVDLTDSFRIAEGVIEVSQVTIWGFADLEKSGLEQIRFGNVIRYQNALLQCRGRRQIHDEHGIRTVFHFAPFETSFSA
jgi:hypothetical protein